MNKENTVRLRFSVPAPQQETLVALLSGIGFYAFEENEDSLDAFIQESAYEAESVEAIIQPFGKSWFPPSESEIIPPKDWNAEWEKGFEGVVVEDFVEIRPPFKERSPGVKHSIIVFPKMAFGTGHHSTTWLASRYCRELDFSGKTVLDMGCGTGILAMLASLEGAKQVTGIDIDEWAWENARENLGLNQINNVEIIQGTAADIPTDSCYEILLANINRNVLLEDRDKYRQHLCPGGDLVLSGFYNFDEDLILKHYQEAGFRQVHRAEREEWVMLGLRLTESN